MVMVCVRVGFKVDGHHAMPLSLASRVAQEAVVANCQL
jgi:hypothetical protein